jgi:hypothetical protein
MVETEKKPLGIAVNRDDDAGPAVADVAMTRRQRALWITLLCGTAVHRDHRGTVPHFIFRADPRSSGQIRAESDHVYGTAGL